MNKSANPKNRSIRVRLTEEVYQVLKSKGDMSSLVRELIEEYVHQQLEVSKKK